MRNMDEILDDIEELLDKSATLPFINHKKVIDAERLAELINDIRLNLPHELQEARKIEYEGERILNDAKANADGVIRRAEEKAAQLVAKEPIVLEAKKRSEDILSETREKAVEMLKRAQASSAKLEKDAAMSAAKMLSDAETMYNKNLMEVKTAKERLQRALKSSPALKQNNTSGGSSGAANE